MKPDGRSVGSRLGPVAWLRLRIVLGWLCLTPCVSGQPLIVGVAGSGPTTSGGFDGDPGPAAQSRLNSPAAIAVGPGGALYICDQLNHRIRLVDPATASIVTVAGSGPSDSPGFSGDGGPATQARLNGPAGIAVDVAGNLFVADTFNNRIRRVDAKTGIITSIAGSGPSTSGSFAGDGAAATASRLDQPRGLVVDLTGNVLFCDSANHRVRRIDAVTGTIETVAGSGVTGLFLGDYGGDGGPATAARLSVPAAVALDARGNLYIADLLNNRVRLVDSASGIIQTFAGTGGAIRSLTDGPAAETSLGPPFGVAADADGNVYIGTDAGIVYGVAPRTGIVSGLAGKILPGGELCSGAQGDGGQAAGACLARVRGLAVDAQGNVLLCDAGSHRVRKLLMRAPRVTRISPGTISTTRPADLSIEGTGLQSATAVTGVNLLVGGVTLGPLPQLSATTSTLLTAQVPQGSIVGLYTLVIGIPEGANNSLAPERLLRVQRPSAVNGPPLAIVLGPTVLPYEVPFRLDGSASLDLDDGDTISYHWSLATTVPGVPAFDTTSAAVEFVVSRRGNYQFTLSVQDQHGLSASRIVTVVAPDVAPRAVVRSAFIRSFILPDDRGRIPSALTTSTISLDGTQTRSLDGDPVTYRWSLLSKPPASTATDAALLEPQSAVTRLRLGVARGGDGRQLDAGLYRIGLRVSDPAGHETSAVLLVTALAAEDIAPTADPGNDRNVRVTVLDRSPLQLAADIPDPLLPPPADQSPFVRLDGRASIDPNVPPLPLSYEWSVLSLPAGSRLTTLVASTTAAPRFEPDEPGVYRFGLVVRNPLFASERRDVRIAVNVAGGGSVPTAFGFARDRAGNVRSGPAGAVATFVAAVDAVLLDATASTSADAQGRRQLTYRWGQAAGPPVALTPSATSPVAEFVPPFPGRYVFRLAVTDALGVSGEGTPVEVRALPAARPPPELALTSSADTTAATGSDIPEGALESKGESLRVTLPALLTVTARIRDRDGIANGRKSVFWRQLSGPSVELSVTADRATSSPVAATRFAPTTAGVVELECRAQVLDERLGPSGVDVSRKIRIVADTAQVAVPRARARTLNSQVQFGAGDAVVLDGRESVATRGPSAGIRYCWTQVAGPPVVLSDPFSPVTSFVAPDFGDARSRSYRFALFAETEGARSEPAVLSFKADPAPRVSCPAVVETSAGLTLMAVSADPSTSAAVFDAAELLERTRARFVARVRSVPGGRGTFEFFAPGTGTARFAIEGNQGYLVAGGRQREAQSIPGLTWPAGQLTLTLGAGMNLVAFPKGHPTGETAETLRARTGSAFVVRTVGPPQGPGRFDVYIPGLNQPFELQSNRSYLLWVPASRSVDLPAASTGCR
ncbi:MAG: hypothetical protein HY303_13275 [Candidatus Wallbacteria bacterium]|nr:hypothetical protein [Candidatus Wallbacteria bacterium]